MNHRFPWPTPTEVRVLAALGARAGLAGGLPGMDVVLRREAAAVEGRFRQRWTTARLLVRQGAPAKALLAEATRSRAALVAVGWRGHGRFRRLLAGSVSRHLAHNLKCSVMVVAHSGRTPTKPKRFLVGYDGSDHSWRALRFLATLAPPKGNRVLILGALPPLHVPSLSRLPRGARTQVLTGLRRAERERAQEMRARLASAADYLRSHGWAVRTQVAPEAPLHALMEAAGAFRADALVVGARGTSGISRLLLGSVANGVLDRAPCPVIVAR